MHVRRLLLCGVMAASALTFGLMQPASGALGCDGLLAVERADGAYRISVPADLSGLALPAGAFTAEQGGNPIPVTVSRVVPRDVVVSILLDASPETTGSQWADATAAALELLVSLPPNAQVALVVSGRTTRVASALTRDRAAVVTSLSRLGGPAAGSMPEAVAVAAQQIPVGSYGHLVVFEDGRGSSSARLLEGTTGGRELQLHPVRYVDSRAGADRLQPCPAGLPPVAAVDAVRRRVTAQYELSVPKNARATTVRLRYQGVDESAEPSPSSALATPGRGAPATAPSSPDSAAPAPGTAGSRTPPLDAAGAFPLRDLTWVLLLSVAWLVGFFSWVVRGPRDLDAEADLHGAARQLMTPPGAL